ncbi:MAG: glycoside hydrolase family 2 [Tannerella sp.]|jgi:hypothetical protein|nr:glycoside hydrolase family 2 [Tannerella sp.]
MRKTLLLPAFIIFFFSAFAFADGQAPVASLEKGFCDVPDSIRIGVYWYWLSDNISREGVVNDLHAMKKAGITKAYIGNIGLDDLPYGEVKIFSDEWWNIIHAALKTATELGIEIGIFNSPGWSQSGGPWVKPEESMRYLAATDIQVRGPESVTYNIPGYSEKTQLVSVIAYPNNTGVYEKRYDIRMEENQSLTVEMPVDKSRTIRSFTFTTKDYFRTNAELQAKVGDTYRTVRKFEIDRTNYDIIVGFKPESPVVISLPETQTESFRLILEKPQYDYKSLKAGATLSDATAVERYPEQSLAKMFQRPLPYWNTYMWQKQDWYDENSGFVIPENKVTDLTAAVSADGVLKCEAPEGEWTISFLEMKTTGVTNAPATPNAKGLEIDKMSKKHVAAHFDAYIGEILRRIPEADRRCFKIVVQDSYETGGQNWTDDMRERFRETYGYDPLPYLPALYGKVVGNEDVSSRFLWDLRRLIADRIAYDYVGGLREACHQYGLTTWLENYGHWGFPGEFLQYGGQSDEVSGEFWSVGELGDIENRAASSCAHIYGKRRVWAESCTSGGPNFGRYPYDMKQRIDRFFTEGINSTLLHVYIHQPYEDRNPGMSAWFGNDFQRKNTWFGQMDVFTGYLRRANFLLQQGTYVADVAYFIGEDAPKMTGTEDPKLPHGYSYDYINAEVLMTRASVRNGYLTLPDGMRYRMLVLPEQKSMRPELLKKIADLVNDGLAVYGEPPVYSPSLANYPEADRDVQRIGAELFEADKYGAGRVFRRSVDLQKALDALNVRPDMKSTADSSILFIHRTLDDGEIYFLSNQSDKKISFDCEFRVPEGLTPELWNPLTVDVRRLHGYRQTAGSTALNIELDGFESAFVVFRKGDGSSVYSDFRYAATVLESSGIDDSSAYPDSRPDSHSDFSLDFSPKNVIYTVNTPWTVVFEAGKRGPENPVVFDKPTDWKNSTDDKIRYFAGEAVYSTTFKIEKLPSKELYIDLGKVMVMAKVSLNGQYVGGVWTTPYRLNVTDYLKEGDNRMEVTVVNNWQNRLIGDSQLPEQHRPTWTTVNPWKATSPLQSSGLLGPVEIQAFDYDVIK